MARCLLVKQLSLIYFCDLNPGLFRISFDKIKRFISDYTPDNRYGDTVNELIFVLSDKAAEKGLSLIFEGNFKLRKELRQTYKDLADKYSMIFTEINIEAPLEILKDRFIKRIADSDLNGNKLFVRTMDGMLERYSTYMANKNNDIPTFDTSIDSPEKICEEIKLIINK